MRISRLCGRPAAASHSMWGSLPKTAASVRGRVFAVSLRDRQRTDRSIGKPLDRPGGPRIG